MHDRNSFLGNLLVDIRLLGQGTILNPFAQFTSAQRLGMYNNHLPQAQVVSAPEAPIISSGMELRVGEYEYRPSDRKEDCQIMAVVPKLIPGQWGLTLRANPKTTIIYRGNTSGKVDYVDLDAYTKGSDGYGYENTILNKRMISPGNYLPKEVHLQQSPNRISENRVAMGLNANVVYATKSSVSDDAFVISQSLADRLAPLTIKTFTVDVAPNQIPLNLYGDDVESKFMPDVGDKVREDGIIMGFRKPDDISFVTDVMDSALCTPQPMHDQLYYAVGPNAVILNIDVFVNNKQRLNPNVFSQLLKYRESSCAYWLRIVEAYNQAVANGWEITEKFNTLVTRAYALLLAEGKHIPGYTKKPAINLIMKKDPIRHMAITVTYAYRADVATGFKLTGRHGDKGVIGVIRPDEEMPIDAYGHRADIIMDPLSVFNRMNPGQMYEQTVTRFNWFIERRLKLMLEGQDIRQPIILNSAHGGTITLPPVDAEQVKATTPYQLLMEYLTDINYKYAESIAMATPTVADQNALVDAAISQGIQLILPPYCEHVGMEWIKMLAKKYPAPKTPIQYILHKRNGETKVVTTKEAISVGSKYLMLLYRMPKVKAAGPGYISQHKTPIHPNKQAKLLYPVSQTPLRLGEDELRGLLMAVGPAQAARLMGLYANSDIGLNELMKALLTMDKPTQLERIDISTKELIQTNNIIGLTHHMFATVGVQIDDKLVPGDPRYTAYKQWLKTEDIGLEGIVEASMVEDDDATTILKPTDEVEACGCDDELAVAEETDELAFVEGDI